MELQDRIKFLRKNKLHLTQVEFGKKLGVSGSAVTGWEKGDRIPQESTLKLICKEFNVNYSWLIYEKGDIFNTIGETLVNRLADEYQLSSLQIRMIEAIMDLTDAQINSFTYKFFGFKALDEEKDHHDDDL